MQILLTSATSFEIYPLIQYLKINWKQINENNFSFHGNSIYLLISGVGSVSTTYFLTKYFQDFPCQLAIQAGLAGSFRKDLPPGSVVFVKSELLGDMGSEDEEKFYDLFELGLIGENDTPFHAKMLTNPMEGLPQIPDIANVIGLTVNKVSGFKPTIKQRKEKYHPDTESMEGASFHYVCIREKIPFLQFRSISNFTETRNKSDWKIPLAVHRLNQLLIGLLKDL